jgi:hypothetical protein
MCSEDARGFIVPVLQDKGSGAKMIFVRAVTYCYGVPSYDGLGNSTPVLRPMESAIKAVMLRMGRMAYDEVVLPWHQTKLLCSVVVVRLASRGMEIVVVVRKYFGERSRRWLGRAE